MKIEELRGEDGRPLWEGHRNRLRQRMEQEGWDALRPHEMVEIVLYHALPRQDLSNVSRLLVDRFGSVGGVFAASREQLRGVPGVTPYMAEWIGLTGELMRAYRNQHCAQGIRLDCCQQVTAFLKPRLRAMERSELWVLYTDFNYDLITVGNLPVGEAWWDAENTRRIVIDAIGHGARFVFLVLWRPRPFEGMDEVETARLDTVASVMRAAELDLVDCMLVNGRDVFSLRINGRMKAFEATAEGMRLFERYGEGEE